MDRIAITGMGTVSAAGKDLEQTMRAFERVERNAGVPSVFTTSLVYPVFEALSVPSPEIEGDRTIALTMVAVEEALSQAGLTNNLEGYNAGICLGTTVASQLNDIDFYRKYKNTRTVMTKKFQRFVKGNLSEAVNQRVKAEGPSITVVNACSSGADAIGIALSWIKSGICDIAVAGGADELVSVPLSGFRSLGIVSEKLCAPFDKNRDGLNLGEGAGVLVLERETSARKRGLAPKVFVSGYGSVSDAHHMTAPHPDGIGLELAVKTALKQGGIDASDIAFVNAHGTATPDNDRVETKVLKRVFGEDIKFFSTKGYTGHTLGAAGGLEAAFTATALDTGWIPPSAGFVEIDEEIGVAPVTKKTQVEKRFALSTSLAFGGNNVALTFERSEE